MQKGTIILGLSLLLTACDLGFPRMTVNYDNLPQGEIKEQDPAARTRLGAAQFFR